MNESNEVGIVFRVSFILKIKKFDKLIASHLVIVFLEIFFFKYTK